MPFPDLAGIDVAPFQSPLLREYTPPRGRIAIAESQFTLHENVGIAAIAIVRNGIPLQPEVVQISLFGKCDRFEQVEEFEMGVDPRE